MKNLLQLIRETYRLPGGSVQVEGLAPTAKGAFTAALRGSAPLLLVTYSYEQAERLHEDLSPLSPEGLLLVPPADATIYQETDSDPDVTGRRLTALARLQEGSPTLVVAPISAVLQRTLPPDALLRMRVERGEELDSDSLSERLVAMGYSRVDMVEVPGEFSRRGGLVDIFPSTESHPVRIDMFGDEVESIHSFDVESQRSAGEKRSVEILPARELLLDPERVAKALKSYPEHADVEKLREGIYFDGMEYYFPAVYPEACTMLDYLPPDAMVVLDEPHQIRSHWEQLHEELLSSVAERVERGDLLPLDQDHVISLTEAARKLRRGKTLAYSLLPREGSWVAFDSTLVVSAAPMDSFHGRLEMLTEQMRTWVGNGCRVVVASAQPHRVVELLTEQGVPVSPNAEMGAPGVYVTGTELRAGFKLNDARLMVLTDAEVFGVGKPQRPKRGFKKGVAISSLLEINEGDFVVHINHGIGRYLGATRLGQKGQESDYLLVEYAGTDKLYVPVDQIDRLQKYIGSEGNEPALHKLGGNEWAKATRKVKQSVREMAKELVELYASRQSAEGHAFSPDTPWQQEMESAFPYDETPDQMGAIQDVKEDLEAPKPMDRLICGDVGYGKTEVAIRAVFKAVNEGKQAAVLCPTTVLAQQHWNTFTERLAAYPVKMGLLSRFRSRKEQKEVVEGLGTGDVDVVIGTHRLLSKDVQFKDLGLVVVDEEQRFGVAHKERLKQLRKTVDALTLSATPIPRTLHMSLSGIRDMSLINDPPQGRTPIKTHCREYDDELVRDAVLRELDRDGQVYYVHNRVENIEHVADHIRKLVPYAKVEVAHGQMHEDDLERVMYDFYERRFQVLVCTTIIESGLDIPNVNTIVVNNADKMGLSQLYQLRGRVGRSNRQAYAYLLYEPHRIMSDVAEKRLQAVREFTDLGSGFKIALRDLEIRGAGNLLGAEQSGQMASVGFDMYCQILQEAIGELKGEEPERFELPPADLPLDAYIPERYVPTESLRLTFYKKMAAVREEKDVENLADELRDRFGPLPRPVQNSLEVLRLRLAAAGSGVSSIGNDGRQVIVKFGTGIRLAPDVAIKLRRLFPGNSFQPDKVILGESKDMVKILRSILDMLPKALAESKEFYLAKL
ncbi:MAG: transcription-repair coupling factor [Armatimonadota bacterium]